MTDLIVIVIIPAIWIATMVFVWALVKAYADRAGKDGDE